MFGWLKAWQARIGAFAGAIGAPGLFLISFLDSSFIPFPIINDGLLIEFSIKQPSRMPLYALLATLGSIVGCVVLYLLARRGGEAFFHRKAGAKATAIRLWIERNGFGGMLIAALLPPPTPFKVFVFAAGVFEVPLVSFTTAIALARCIRYFGIGYLAIRYGKDAIPFIGHHRLGVVVALVLFVAASYGASRLILREAKEEERQEAKGE